MNLRVIFAATIFILTSVSQDIYASTISIGYPSNPNADPFSMASYFNAGSPPSPFEYQQVYSSGYFGSTPFSINAVSFFDSINNHPIDTEKFSVDFYTTSSSVGNLSKGFGANEGTLLSHFGTYTTVGGGVIGSELSLVGNTFQFDPTTGENLLMVIDVNIAPLSFGSFGSPVFWDGINGSTSRETSYSSNPGCPNANGCSFADNLGLVTQFNGSLGTVIAPAPAPLPVPSAIWLVSSALAGLIGFGRRKSPV